MLAFNGAESVRLPRPLVALPCCPRQWSVPVLALLSWSIWLISSLLSFLASVTAHSPGIPSSSRGDSFSVSSQLLPSLLLHLSKLEGHRALRGLPLFCACTLSFRVSPMTVTPNFISLVSMQPWTWYLNTHCTSGMSIWVSNWHCQIKPPDSFSQVPSVLPLLTNMPVSGLPTKQVA